MSNISHLTTSVIFEKKIYHINFDINETLLPQEDKEKAREEILGKVETLVMAHLVAQAKAESPPTHFTLDDKGAHFGPRVTPHASVNLQPTIDYTKTQSASSVERFQKVFDETLKSRNQSPSYRFVPMERKNNTGLTAQDLWAFISNKKDGYTTPTPIEISEDEDSDDDEDEEDFDSINTPPPRSPLSSPSVSGSESGDENNDVDTSESEEDSDGLP